MRMSSLTKVACWSLGVLVVAATVAEAQPGRQRGRQRGRTRGTRSSFGNLTTNKYLQQQLKLTSTQIKRMKEIDLQLQGSRAIMSESVSKALGISDSQRESIEKARREVYSGLFGRRGGNNGGKRPSREDFMKRFREAGKKAEEATMKVLTSSQKAKWKAMLGSPIDLEKARQRPESSRGRGTPKKRPDV